MGVVFISYEDDQLVQTGGRTDCCVKGTKIQSFRLYQVSVGVEVEVGVWVWGVVDDNEFGDFAKISEY